jgi:hypothetical protein
MSTENMRLLMEAAKGYVEVDENFITEPEQASVDAPFGDSFRDEEPAQPITVVANVDIPAMFMNAGDELYLEPTNNQGEAYSEENGLTYEWDFIFHLIRDKNMLDFKDDTEVEFEEGIAGDAVKDVYRKATGRVTDKAGLERMVNIYVEQAISHLELGMQMRNENDPEILVKTITSVRQDLIELQKWIRERK